MFATIAKFGKWLAAIVLSVFAPHLHTTALVPPTAESLGAAAATVVSQSIATSAEPVTHSPFPAGALR